MKTDVSRRSRSLAFYLLPALLLLGTGCTDGGDPPSAYDPYAGFERQEFRYQLPDGRIVEGVGILQGDRLLIGGDILIPAAAAKNSVSQAVATTGGLWPRSRVIYQFDPSLDTWRRQQVLNAMTPWRNAGIVFSQRTTQSAYVWITGADPIAPLSCRAGIGFTGGVSTYNASNACGTHDFVHEWGHVLGLFHEHERNDRAQFIQILLPNRIGGTLASQGRSSYEYSPYDFDSIMHYNPFDRNADGSIAWDRQVFEALNSRSPFTIGFGDTPSWQDILAIQSMYWTDPPCGPGTGMICP